jgi:hypothetical protein
MIYVTILITERVNGKTVNLVTPVSSARTKVMDLRHVRKLIFANKIKIKHLACRKLPTGDSPRTTMYQHLKLTLII